MRLLVLGGTAFLSRAVAREAVRRGHQVTCACRGESGPVPAGAEHRHVDRSAADGSAQADAQADALADALAGPWDAVVDVARHPSWVRKAVAALPEAHWVFVSTINVYPDTATPGGTPATLPVHEPITTDEDPRRDEVTYGAMKVACEDLVRRGTSSATVVRPGLIVGPGDPTGRFTYWPWRLGEQDRAPEVLAPGSPKDATQVIDVRDLAGWLVDCAEERRSGVYDGVGPVLPRGELLAQVAAGVGSAPTWTWVDQDFLVEQAVEPWAGDGSVPLWLPVPEYAGLMAHDPGPAEAAGLRARPVSETARDTHAWLASEPDAAVTGMSRAREREVLDAWQAAAHPTASRGRPR